MFEEIRGLSVFRLRAVSRLGCVWLCCVVGFLSVGFVFFSCVFRLVVIVALMNGFVW